MNKSQPIKNKEKLILLLSLYGVKSLNYAGIVLQKVKGLL